MPRRHLLIVLAAALLLLLTAPTPSALAAPQQQTKASSASVLRAASAVGLRYWGAAPCGGRVTTVMERRLPTGLAVDSDAWVTFGSSRLLNDLTAPPSSYSRCAIGYAGWRWPTVASMREDWDLLCATTIHELGHLLGHQHDTTPGSVMAPVFRRASDLPAICRATRPGRSSA